MLSKKTRLTAIFLTFKPGDGVSTRWSAWLQMETFDRGHRHLNPNTCQFSSSQWRSAATAKVYLEYDRGRKIGKMCLLRWTYEMPGPRYLNFGSVPLRMFYLQTNSSFINGYSDSEAIWPSYSTCTWRSAASKALMRSFTKHHLWWPYLSTLSTWAGLQVEATLPVSPGTSARDHLICSLRWDDSNKPWESTKGHCQQQKMTRWFLMFFVSQSKHKQGWKPNPVWSMYSSNMIFALDMAEYVCRLLTRLRQLPCAPTMPPLWRRASGTVHPLDASNRINCGCPRGHSKRNFSSRNWDERPKIDKTYIMIIITWILTHTPYPNHINSEFLKDSTHPLIPRGQLTVKSGCLGIAESNSITDVSGWTAPIAPWL